MNVATKSEWMRWTRPLLLLASIGLICVPARAYVDVPPATFGRTCQWSTHAVEVEVKSVDAAHNVITWHILRDLKGHWPRGGDTIIQNLTSLPEPLRSAAIKWATPGKHTVIFALESYAWSHTYVESGWYAIHTADWKMWDGGRVEPVMLRTYCGSADHLAPATAAVVAGRTAIVACAADAQPGANGKPVRVQCLRASLDRTEFHLDKDFVHWGADDFTALEGMPGFERLSVLPFVGPGVSDVVIGDYDGDGHPDVILCGKEHAALLHNSGNSLLETEFPGGIAAARWSGWANLSADAGPALLVVTPGGPRLLQSKPAGAMQDISAMLPTAPYWNLLAAAWIDYDGDKHPDLLLADGYTGLHLYRNRIAERGADPRSPAFEEVTEKLGLGSSGPCAGARIERICVADVNQDGRPDLLLGAGRGLLLLNTPNGFVHAPGNGGIDYDSAGVTPVFGDFDGRGAPGLFVPQRSARPRLYRNDGKGHFTDVIDHAGAMGQLTGITTCAAWANLHGSDHLDLVVGCDRAPNRMFWNKGDGTFSDATESVGLDKRIFNTRGIGIADLDGNGTLDLVFNNEGQESVLLLSRPAK